MNRKSLTRSLTAALTAALLLTACAAPSEEPGSPNTPGHPAPTEGDATLMPFLTSDETPFERPADAKNPVVTIEMASGGTIVLELYYDKAPNTVRNFVSLVRNGFYDGLIFHRTGPGFMIQGGCPDGTGTGHPGYRIPGEFAENGFTGNDVSHLEGVISMARSANMDSAGSQFFICAGNASALDGQYAAFGKVVQGLDTVGEIVSQPWSVQLDMSSGRPAQDQVMKTVTVDTFGVDYPPPVGTKS